jgi:hypothetical protein
MPEAEFNILFKSKEFVRVYVYRYEKSNSMEQSQS